MSARQAQEPMDNISARSMDQECFEGDTLCRIRPDCISVLSRRYMQLDSFDYIIPTFEMHKRYRDIEASMKPFIARDASANLTQDFSR